MSSNKSSDSIFIDFINSLSEKDKKGFHNKVNISLLRRKYLYKFSLSRHVFQFINYLVVSFKTKRKIYTYNNLLIIDRGDNYIIEKINNLEELKINKIKIFYLNIRNYFNFRKSLNNLMNIKIEKKIKNINSYLLFFYFLDYKINFFYINNITKFIDCKYKRFACPNEYTASFLGIISGLKLLNLEFILLSLRRGNFKKMNHPINYIDYHISTFESYLYFLKNKYYFENTYILKKKNTYKIKTLTKENINLGIFLSSYYESTEEELEYLVDNKITYELKNIINKYKPLTYTLFPHPNDEKIGLILKRKKINIIHSNNKNNTINQLNLAVIGNTSVGDLLLDKEISVLYTNKLDNYEFDYFGYIQDNAILDITRKYYSIEEINNFYIQKEIHNYSNINKPFDIVDNINQALDLYTNSN